MSHQFKVKFKAKEKAEKYSLCSFLFLQKISLLQLGATDAWGKHIFHWFS